MSPHRVLVVGVGSIGERHLRCLQATGRAELALCESNPELRRRIAERYGANECYTDLEEALSNASCRPDAAVIATPAPLHVPMATRLAEAGVHVLIEKPLSTSLNGIETLQARVSENNIKAAVAYVYRAHTALQDMKKAIAAGRFGRPVQIVATAGQHFPTYRPAYKNTYYTRRETGGGAVQDALTHILNGAEFLVGPIDRVMADADHMLVEGVDVEDTAHVLTRHGGVMGCYNLNQHQAPNEVVITVVCECGTARFEMHKNRWRSMTDPGGEWQEEHVFSGEWDVTFRNQENAFLDMIEGKGDPLCSLAEGVQTLKVNLAILDAIERSNWSQV